LRGLRLFLRGLLERSPLRLPQELLQMEIVYKKHPNVYGNRGHFSERLLERSPSDSPRTFTMEDVYKEHPHFLWIP